MAGMYVKDFDFKKTAADMSAAKCAGYAKGGRVFEKATGESYPSREAMVKHEAKETPRMRREELVERSKVTAPARRRVPVAPTSPLIAMKTGGKVPSKAGSCYAEGGSIKADMKQDKAMVKTAVHKHEKALHKGEPMTKLAKGGSLAKR